MKRELSLLQERRLNFKPILPHVLENISLLVTEKGKPTLAKGDVGDLKALFEKTFGQPIVKFVQKDLEQSNNPMRIGVVFSGGQASGGHNVISGLFDALLKLQEKSLLFGFLNGPGGIVENKTIKITKELLSVYRNQGGFDLIGSGRTKIETEEQLRSSLKTVNELQLDGLVIIGGDDSNTNAAILAEYFLQNDCATQVIGVPKTIDGDLKNEHIEISFGFDTATKVYSEMIGNILCDAQSAKKYYHFVKLMGRSASHVTLECALKTRPNITIIAEEVEQKKMTLEQIVSMICDVICKRSEQKKDYGVILIPEGLIEFIPQMKALISYLNKILSNSEYLGKIHELSSLREKVNYIAKMLPADLSGAFSSLPERIQEQFLLDRDPHGNVQVSLIETEKLVLMMVEKEIKRRKEEKKYIGKFKAVSHFFGYEGRASMPSNFDAQYCYSLGYVAAVLLNQGLTGYMSSLYNLTAPVEQWQIQGVPLTMMMNMELRSGKTKPVIQKALVELDKGPYKSYLENREKWKFDDRYCNPGPIQFFGKREVTDILPISLNL